MNDDKQIKDLRSHLFSQMERLSNPELNLEKELKRSEAMVNIGNVIVNSAKAEVDFMRVTKSKGSGFIPVIPESDGPKQLKDGE